MFMKMRIHHIGLLLLLLTAFSCSDYSKILQSTDYEFKYKKAIEYYEQEDYVKASTLLQELTSIYRGTNQADDIYYYYAKSMFGQGNYLMAEYYFSTLIDQFPGSDYIEEAYYMDGYCYYLLSPKPRLDQDVTQLAIEALRLYINLYPFNERVSEANDLIAELQDKLVYKSYLSAKLYFDFENYKAATIALTNSLEEYPNSKYREDIMYMLLKSKYLLAINSVEDKKEQRLSDALDEYFSFVDEFPESDHLREVRRFYETTAELLDYQEEVININ